MNQITDLKDIEDECVYIMFHLVVLFFEALVDSPCENQPVWRRAYNKFIQVATTTKELFYHQENISGYVLSFICIC